MPRLVLIGLVAGLFSALFGVGGGIVIVPLLVLAAGLGQREATATSLAAIAVTATAGSAFYAAGGEVDPALAAVVGIPGTLGAFVGASLQQRLSQRVLALLFAGLLVAVALTMLLT